VIRKATGNDELPLRGKIPPASGPGKERELAVALDRKGVAACFGLAGGDIKDLLYKRDTGDCGTIICVYTIDLANNMLRGT
jgi:hypothetical protein